MVAPARLPLERSQLCVHVGANSTLTDPSQLDYSADPPREVDCLAMEGPEGPRQVKVLGLLREALEAVPQQEIEQSSDRYYILIT